MPFFDSLDAALDSLGRNHFGNDVLAEKLTYIFGAGSPTATSTVPSFVGQHYLDTDADAWYIATGTSAASDFKAMGGSSAFLDGVTAGTAAASKAVVLDANSKIDTLDVTSLKLNGTSLLPTATELNNLADQTYNYEILTAANVMTQFEPFKTFYLNNSAGFQITLPAPFAGSYHTYIVKTAPTSGAYTIVTDSSANIIVGNVMSSDLNSASDGDTEASGADTITFVANTAAVGDRIDIFCDGTNYYATVFAAAAGGVTFTTAS